MSQLFTTPFQTTLDANASPVSGAKLSFYNSGTLVPAPIYADAALTVPLLNPIYADAAGRFPPIYLQRARSYRVIVADAGGTTIRDIDPIGDLLSIDLASGNGGTLVGLKRLETGTKVEVLQDWSRRIVYPESWGAVGDGLTDDQPAFQAMHDSLSGGEEIAIGARSYRFNSALRVNRSLGFKGRAKENVSYLMAGSANQHVIQVYDNGSGSSFEKLHWVAGVQRTAGSYLDLYNCNRMTVSDCRMDEHAYGITASLVRTLNVEKTFFRLCAPSSRVADSSSIQLGANGYTESICIDRCLASNQQSPDVYGDSYQPYTWLDLLYTDNIHVTDCSAQYQGASFVIRPGSGQFVAIVNVKGGCYDTSRQALIVRPNGGFTTRARFVGVGFIVSHVTAAVIIDGSVDLTGNPTFKTITDLGFDPSCFFLNNTGAQTALVTKGSHIDGIDIGGYFANNGDGVAYGIDIDLQAGSNIRVMDVYMGARGGTPATERIGLNVGTGVSGGYSRLYAVNVPTPLANNSSSTFKAL